MTNGKTIRAKSSAVESACRSQQENTAGNDRNGEALLRREAAEVKPDIIRIDEAAHRRCAVYGGDEQHGEADDERLPFRAGPNRRHCPDGEKRRGNGQSELR